MDSRNSVSGLTNVNFTLFDSHEEESKVGEFLSKHLISLNPKSTNFSKAIEVIARMSKKTQFIDGLIEKKQETSQLRNWILGMSGVLTVTSAFGVAAGPAILATLVAAGLAKKLHKSAEDALFSIRKSYKIENFNHNPDTLLHNTHVSFVQNARDDIFTLYPKEIAKFNIITMYRESLDSNSHVSSLTNDVLDLIFSVYVDLIKSMSEDESDAYCKNIAEKLYNSHIENVPTSSYAVQFEKQIWSDYKALSMV